VKEIEPAGGEAQVQSAKMPPPALGFTVPTSPVDAAKLQPAGNSTSELAPVAAPAQVSECARDRHRPTDRVAGAQDSVPLTRAREDDDDAVVV